MIPIKEKVLRLVLFVVFALLASGCDKNKQDAHQAFDHIEQTNSTQAKDRKVDEHARQVFDQIMENLRYSRYWYGTPSIGDGYAEGKQVSALIFWTKKDRRSKIGLCFSNLRSCFATRGDQIVPEMEQMSIGRSLTAKEAFESFVENGLDANTIKILPQIVQPPLAKAPPVGSSNTTVPKVPSTSVGQPFSFPKRLSLADFEYVETTITLPALGLPASISHREIPKEAAGEAKRIKQYYTCWYSNSVRPPGCTGSLVFAYYQEMELNWFVLRTCSSACPSGFQGDSIQLLRRGDGGWEASGGGGLNSPKEEVARLKQKIEQAEMFRLQLP